MKKRTRVYALNEESSRLRTATRMENRAQKALRKGYPQKGVKGTSIITALPLFNWATCVIPEYMHSVL